MQRVTLSLENDEVRSLVWLKDYLVDFVKGRIYSLDDRIIQKIGYNFNYRFDAAVISDDGIYVVIYHKLGTKGILLKNGEILREINRSYYQANIYEYPIVFFTASNGKVYLIHCPIAYNQLDFEDVETGEIITNIVGRDSSDFFHSRLEVSPNHKHLLSKGWVWHPYDQVLAFDLEACLANPLLLDHPLEPLSIRYEVCTAGFIDDNFVLLGVSDDAEYFDEDESTHNPKKNQIAIWDISNNTETQLLDLSVEIGQFIVVDESKVIDLYKYPKLINFKSGELMQQFPDISSGLQRSSIIHHLKDLSSIAWNHQLKRLAINVSDRIEIIEF